MARDTSHLKQFQFRKGAGGGTTKTAPAVPQSKHKRKKKAIGGHVTPMGAMVMTNGGVHCASCGQSQSSASTPCPNCGAPGGSM